MKIRYIILAVILAIIFGCGLYAISIYHPVRLSSIIISNDCFETKDVFLIIPKCFSLAFYIPINSLDEKYRTEFLHNSDLLLISYDNNIAICADKYIHRTVEGYNIFFTFNTYNKEDESSFVSPGKYYISFVYHAVESIHKDDMHVCSFLPKTPLFADIFLKGNILRKWKEELASNGISFVRENHVVYFLQEK